ncbi:bifunctional tRNA (5-methylaminomethyl-2-thiouridine)(34)-methyltransferase MnmD/FAD-dependent 5-carboxymethylaminomethyl-2-thiouridine(34) oxidoreductase MnmC [Caballeronia sp. BR00000012568055]|uniref:bifunctional tRNA (5-methylaminomethyl-2-thiouridine)(34)-methyltransferase MnmD/FAD-dependent 5-carboxymethylaminomethyl-2-thiouridine(34) oxidoreductase MnmC n=1 Tax=Caballeronia sp. BR00000012568055 TaxID=2918761 RepID=UPI0023F77308|nr:bifunctional tRNA (5-methylaminomethyl-2-thiouridine)(34)-methyltransferase MnmD/FAD-dependent 5-carboxymethylaminomethyl-2-thiouridine(34) oxidoreductase MnmC [Caballeronia sp. BR00000012568055]
MSSAFIAVHDLPARWRNRHLFTFADTDFGDGARFLSLLRCWRADDARCDRLHYIAIAGLTPPCDELAAIWPMRVPGVHRIELDAGRVVLTLAIGDEDMLSRLWARVDAFHVGACADPKRIAKTMARFAADHATVSADVSLEGALRASGFESVSTDNDRLVARFAPRWRVRRHEPPIAHEVKTREAIVIGAGLAGCAVTSTLAERGWKITLIDRHNAPARDASGNPAGVFHPIVWRDDSIAARLTRAGFLLALDRWQALERAGHDLKRSRSGLLQIADTNDDAEALAQAIARFDYPREYVTPVSSDEAARIAGVHVTRGGWFFPRGGAISPAAICAAQLAQSGDALTTRMNTQISRIAYDGTRWQVFDTSDVLIAQAPVLVLANAHEAQRLAHLHGEPTRSVRGQLSLLDTSALDGLRVPVIGEGYALPLSAQRTLIGATYDIDDPDREIRDAGHIENIERLANMLPDVARERAASFEGRVAFRCVTSDRMPMIGQLADESLARRDAAKLSGAWPLDLPRAPGLYGAFAFGSRGLVWATLAAELIASQIEGAPWPIERELAEAIDPARFLLRALRHGEITAS